ncbi:MAG: mannitol dehydrogenase family protein [Hyphomonadaceae bacterium]|nr:mannitol dehydrogenase family protein [Hyphomonadaceae bacterium]
MTRLSTSTISDLPVSIARPAYDRAAVKTGIVHLGIGAFHRAHQAVFTEACLDAGDLRWGILGASLRSASVAEQLNPQDGLYGVQVRDGSHSTTRVIGACSGVLVAPDDPVRLVEAMASPDVHVVSLTVTEKGYHLDPATGALMLDDPAVASDVAGLSGPRTAPGFIVAALERRRERGLGPFTCLSCDNLPENGERLADAVITLAQARDPALGDWIAHHGAFPSSMVDRIVPATTEADIAAHSRATGLEDRGLVKTEPFSQWVIEDRFAGPRPDWEAAGVQLTGDVRPWELAKLRLLNGAHSGLAYLGALAGHEYVHQAVADPAFAAFVDQLHEEAQATLSPPSGLDVAAYRADLKARFANAALMHRTRQIAMDGSQKLPQRLLFTIRTRLDRGQGIAALALAVAGWMRWQAGVDERGSAYQVDDPLAATTRAVFDAGGGSDAIARGLMQIEAVFGADLARDERLACALGAALNGLMAEGAAHSVRTLARAGMPA